jgi:hypothetical protein
MRSGVYEYRLAKTLSGASLASEIILMSTYVSTFFDQLQMVADWWHPVLFANTGVPVPADGASIQRQPIIITHNPSYTKPPFIPHFKPSYIWAGDSGEWVAHEMLQELESAGGYLRVDAAQLNQLLAWRNHCMLFHLFMAAS